MKRIRPLVFMTISLQLSLVSCQAQVAGCTDPKASNFNPSATVNDGSCSYDPISLSPESTYILSEQLSGTSGLILWDGNLWTHNDNADQNLYGLDTTLATIDRVYELEGVENLNWEEIAQDRDYIYLGDFGNNSSGNRTDLHILRITKASLKEGKPSIDTIWFAYEDQSDLSPVGPNQTDFDCEAFVVAGDSIYLFTKQWTSAGTTLYRLPKTPGTHVAMKKNSYQVDGLVTGATMVGSKNLVVLCGYTTLLEPFLYLLYDYKGMDFFSGNKRRVALSLPFHQVEGITTDTGLKYYVSNELFVFEPVVTIPQKLHILKLTEILGDYLSGSGDPVQSLPFGFELYPNPARDYINFDISPSAGTIDFEVVDEAARVVLKGVLTQASSRFNISQLLPGYYAVRFGSRSETMASFLKL